MPWITMMAMMMRGTFDPLSAGIINKEEILPNGRTYGEALEAIRVHCVIPPERTASRTL